MRQCWRIGSTTLIPVAQRVQERGVVIVAPLGDSGTAETSRSIALLDPNGIRIEVSEY